MLMRLALGLKAVEAEEEGLVVADTEVDMEVVEEEMTKEEAVEEATGKVAEDREVEVNAPGEWCSDIQVHNRTPPNTHILKAICPPLPVACLPSGRVDWQTDGGQARKNVPCLTGGK